jgi:hypothetical protein
VAERARRQFRLVELGPDRRGLVWLVLGLAAAVGLVTATRVIRPR